MEFPNQIAETQHTKKSVSASFNHRNQNDQECRFLTSNSVYVRIKSKKRKKQQANMLYLFKYMDYSELYWYIWLCCHVINSDVEMQKTELNKTSIVSFSLTVKDFVLFCGNIVFMSQLSRFVCEINSNHKSIWSLP